ncbi:MAG: ABC transporter permease [Thermoanaerobaculum sp.]
MKRLWTLAEKDLLLLWRQPVALFWVLGYPLLVGVLFGLAFSGFGRGGRAMVLLVADEDGGPQAQGLVAALSQEKALAMSKTSLLEAQAQVRRGKATAYLHIPSGFSSTSLFVPKGSAVLELGIDPRRQAEAGLIEGLISKAWFSQMGKAMMNPQAVTPWSAEFDRWLSQAPPSLQQPLRDLKRSLQELALNLNSLPTLDESSQNPFTRIPLRRVEVAATRKAPPSAFAITFPQASLWALLATVFGFSLSVVRERAAGTWLRLRMAPLSAHQVIGGKFLACYLTSLASLGLLWLISTTFFPVDLGGRWLGLLTVIVCPGFCFSAIMLLIATLGKTEETVSGWGWAILLVLAMFGGGMIPLAFMPSWLAAASKLNPAQWTVLALEGATWRGFGPGELLPHLALLVGLGVVVLLCAGLRLSRQH